jgi:hypothetical protein
MPRGGYQQPSSPAPVSGPGAMSKRTDRGQPIRDPGGLAYGDNQELRTVQGAAPMSQAPSAPAPADIPLADMSPNLTDPTNRPGRSVFTGMPFGPGAGPEALASAEPSAATRSKLNNALPTLLRAAESPDVSPEFRRLVAMIRSGSLG